jgi:hypothetical protein
MLTRKMLATLPKMLTKKCRQHSQKNVEKKIVGNTSGKCWWKNIGNTPKNVNETMVVPLLKNVDEKKCWQYFR